MRKNRVEKYALQIANLLIYIDVEKESNLDVKKLISVCQSFTSEVSHEKTTKNGPQKK